MSNARFDEFMRDIVSVFRERNKTDLKTTQILIQRNPKDERYFNNDLVTKKNERLDLLQRLQDCFDSEARYIDLVEEYNKEIGNG